ncbi:hypothetical protein JOB18_001156 [Solea senegalensis]|uniref:Uncharacterized protein n=1 Tax=Solea senegalensis TaxID=28829 RepID=A0AAV6SLI9_SOLSE|nr:hypothetical protein JOB18_001156 [Solea senegalensis]
MQPEIRKTAQPYSLTALKRETNVVLIRTKKLKSAREEQKPNMILDFNATKANDRPVVIFYEHDRCIDFHLQKCVTAERAECPPTTFSATTRRSGEELHEQKHIYPFLHTVVRDFRHLTERGRKVGIGRSEAAGGGMAVEKVSKIGKLCGVPYHTAQDNSAPVQRNDPVCLLTSEGAPIHTEESLAVGQSADNRDKTASIEELDR